MTTALARTEGAFIGHAIASQYNPSIFMALNVSDSLIDCRAFDGPDILSRHLYLYHTKKYEIGEVTKYIYQEAVQHTKDQSSLTRENFRFDQTRIDQLVKSADKKCDGHTAGCGPAQRSYPLAFCSFISDDDLFNFTKLEAKLTHENSLAGEVAGIVNLICRSLLKNQNWIDAVRFAFGTPKLAQDIIAIYGRHQRFLTPAIETHSAYAPTVLNAALHYVSNSTDASQAIAKAHNHDKDYCAPIVGILAGARWGIPVEMFQQNINDEKLKIIRETASKLNSFWKLKPGSVTA
jgi:ADP-ribosylglycohydrolase